ncbi:MAG TPA: radical SAM protein, partial [Prolixibacteraceae bacterium]|nr:radical SAM protein [Prolixibacteraceae bacterium]
MAGIYVHIPFCRRRCHYCDFYKTTEVTRLSFFKEALVVEAELQSDFLKGERVKTVYFGGGTPSLLGAEDVAFLMGTLRRFFKLDPSAEVSLEVNPDDVDSGVAESWARAGVNRLSIGIQSFRDSHLRLMNRRHTARQAFQAVDYARGAGL